MNELDCHTSLCYTSLLHEALLDITSPMVQMYILKSQSGANISIIFDLVSLQIEPYLIGFQLYLDKCYRIKSLGWH